MNRQENTESIINGLREIIEGQQLRDSQRDVLEQYMSNPEEHQTGVFNLATGFGKTRMMTVLALAYLRKNPRGRIVLAVPSQTLVKDTTGGGIPTEMQKYNQMVNSFPLDIGLFYANKKDTKNQIIVTTYSSLEKLRKEIPAEDVGLLLLDEAHHAISDARQSTIRGFTNASTYGMTATPWYDPERDITHLLGKVIAQVDVAKSISEGDLASCKNTYIASDLRVDLSDVKHFNGDWDEDEYYKAIDRAIERARSANQANAPDLEAWKDAHHHIAHEIAKFYQSYQDEDARIGRLCDTTDPKHPKMKKCMINCRSQEEARIQANELNKLFGRMVAGVWTTDTKDKSILDNFINGSLPVICQVGKLGEGFDMPELDMCINYPTCSRVLEAQRGGRPLRLYTDRTRKKTALVVDLVFGHPDYDNIVEAAHENGQVLYADILGEPVIEEEVKGTTLPPMERDEGKKAEKEEQKIQLNGFSVISGTKELMSLYQGANLNENRQTVHSKRAGMLTVSDLAEKIVGINLEYAKRDDIWKGKRILRGHKAILEQFYKNQRTFVAADGKTKFLVEKIRNEETRKVEYALHEDPNAFDLFLTYLNDRATPEIFYTKVLSPNESISVKELSKKYNRKIPNALESAFSRAILHKDKNDFFVYSGQKKNCWFCFNASGEPVIENSPIAETDFISRLLAERADLSRTRFSEDFLKTLGNNLSLVANANLKDEALKCIKYQRTFYDQKTGTDKPIITTQSDENGIVLVPDLAAIDPFIRNVLYRNSAMGDIIPEINTEFFEKFGFTEGISKDRHKAMLSEIQEMMKTCFSRRKTFHDSQTDIDEKLVNLVLNKDGKCSLILNQSQEAEDKFLDEVIEANPFLLLSDKREGRVTSEVLSGEGIMDTYQDCQDIEVALKYLYESQFEYYDKITQSRKPIVDIVQSLTGESPYALTPSLEIQGQFKKFYERERKLYEGYRQSKYSYGTFGEFLERHQAEFELPPIRKGMKLSWDLADKLHDDSRAVFVSLRRYYEEGRTFTDSEGNKHFLVELVKTQSGKERFALNGDPKAFGVFAVDHISSRGYSR